MIRLLFLLVALLCASLGGAQTLPSDPIPATDPVVWREESRDDEFVEERTTFPSPVLSGSPKNDVVPLRLFLPADRPGPFPVAVVLHYWGASDQRAEVSLAHEMNRRGIAAALIALPYHLERTPPGSRSGELALTPDPVRLKGTILQGVLDVRRTLDVLESRGDLRKGGTGIVGISLGALVASLAYAVDPRLDRAAFLLGGVDFARIIWRSSLATVQREVLRRQGWTEAKLRAALADVEPENYLKPRLGSRTFVVGGRYDTVVPPESTERLAQLLGEPERLTLETGHYGGIFVQRRLLREVASFLDASFAGRLWTAPKRIYAPTLRLGVKYDVPIGLDVGVGIDLLRFDRKGDSLLTFLVTPRGVQLFAGTRVWRQLHFGVTGSTRGIAVGVMWSVVL